MEEKKVSLFKKLENNVLVQVIFFVVSMVVIVGAYVGLSKHAEKVVFERTVREEKVEIDNKILTTIEDVTVRDDTVTFLGWAMRLDSIVEETQLFLEDVNKGENLILFVQRSEREEVEEYFSPEWEFGDVGFFSTVEATKLNKDICYEIFIYLTYQTEKESAEGTLISVKEIKKISSGKYLYNGELFQYNPLTFEKPAINDAELDVVIEEGEVRGYDEKEQIWIYVYEGRLYFITNPAFGSMEEKKIGVPIMPRTSRSLLLPEHRIQVGFDHLGFYYEDKAYQREGIVPYQVVVKDLPTSYPITYIDLGLYSASEEQWVKNFMIPMADWSFNNAK